MIPAYHDRLRIFHSTIKGRGMGGEQFNSALSPFRRNCFVTKVGTMLISFVSSSLMIGNVLLAAQDGIDVTVHCDAVKGISGVKLRVLQSTPLGVAPVRGLSEVSFDVEGDCRVALPPDEYVFEVAHVESQRIIALRASPRRITKTASVEIPVAEPVRVAIKPDEKSGLPIDEIAIRSMAASGEVVWTRSSSEPPELVLSPGQSYRMRALGGEGDIRFAFWGEVTAKRAFIILDGKDVCRCKFKIRDDGPEIRAAHVNFQFPDGASRFPVTGKTVFLTNRRFLSYGYGVELTNGRQVLMRPWLGMVKSQQEFLLGGPFTVDGWVRVMLRKPVKGPETHHLVWDANLYDGSGHMVLADRSQIEWQKSIRTASGQEVDLKAPLSKSDVAEFEARGDSFKISVSYFADKLVQKTFPPTPFRPFGDRRFHTLAPALWGMQAVNYVERAERVFHLIEDLEGKPSKNRVAVKWHDMKGTAWGCGPSGGTAHIIMPFSELRGSFDYYDSPWALAHEMLHTFGYGHGQRMSVMTSLVERRFQQYRWYMADHPTLDPETAFQGFRNETRFNRAAAVALLEEKLEDKKEAAMRREASAESASKKGKGKGKGK